MKWWFSPRESAWKTPYTLPADTAEAVMADTGNCENFGLLLDRYVAYSAAKGGLQLVREFADRRALGFDFEHQRELLEACRQRWCEQAESLGAVTFTARPQWRVIVGLSTNAVPRRCAVTRRSCAGQVAASPLPGSAADRAWAPPDRWPSSSATGPWLSSLAFRGPLSLLAGSRRFFLSGGYRGRGRFVPGFPGGQWRPFPLGSKLSNFVFRLPGLLSPLLTAVFQPSRLPLQGLELLQSFQRLGFPTLPTGE